MAGTDESTLAGRVLDGDRRAYPPDLGAIASEVSPFQVPITNIYDVDKDGRVYPPDLGATAAAVSPFALPLISP